MCVIKQILIGIEGIEAVGDLHDGHVVVEHVLGGLEDEEAGAEPIIIWTWRVGVDPRALLGLACEHVGGWKAGFVWLRCNICWDGLDGGAVIGEDVVERANDEHVSVEVEDFGELKLLEDAKFGHHTLPLLSCM